MAVTGRQIAAKAEQMYGKTYKSGGACLAAVQNVLDKFNIKTKRVVWNIDERPLHACNFPQFCFETQSFKDTYRLSNDLNVGLDTLPLGSIAVYNKVLPKHPHGHIEIKTDGRAWTSDYKQNIRITYAGKRPIAIYIPIYP